MRLEKLQGKEVSVGFGNGDCSFEGVLEYYDDDVLEIRTDGRLVMFPMSSISYVQDFED